MCFAKTNWTWEHGQVCLLDIFPSNIYAWHFKERHNACLCPSFFLPWFKSWRRECSTVEMIRYVNTVWCFDEILDILIISDVFVAEKPKRGNTHTIEVMAQQPPSGCIYAAYLLLIPVFVPKSSFFYIWKAYITSLILLLPVLPFFHQTKRACYQISWRYSSNKRNRTRNPCM